MNRNWELKTLKDVCDNIFAGGDVPKNNFSKFKTNIYNIPIFANGAKDKGLYGFTDIKKVIQPSITVSARGTIGYSEIRNEPFFPIVRLIVLIPNTNIISLEFLKYIIDNMEFKNTGTSIPQLTIPMITKYEAFIPLIEEQKRIVKILDKAFELIEQAKANIEKNIENTKELFQSRLNEIFSQKGDGWEEITLGDIGKVSMCKRILKKQTNSISGIPFYKIGTFGKKANSFIPEEIYNEFKEKYSFPKKGDILLSASGTIGRRVIYDGKPAYFQDSNIVWIDNDEKKVLNEYLYKFYGYCNWNPSLGATISRLYNDDLRRIIIPIPVFSKQKEIVEELDKLNEQTKQLEQHYKQKLKNLEELKKSILQKAFSGELLNDS